MFFNKFILRQLYLLGIDFSGFATRMYVAGLSGIIDLGPSKKLININK